MIIDGIVLAVLFVSALIAFFRGFIREVLTIFGVVGALAASYFGADHLAPHMHSWLGVDINAEKPQKLFDIVPYTLVADVLSYGLIFVIVVIALSLLSHFLAERAKALGLGAVDRSLGVVFGLVRGVLLIGILYTPVYLYFKSNPDEKDSVFDESRTVVYMEMTASWMLEFFPKGLTDHFEKSQQGEQDSQSNPALNQAREALERMDLIGKGNKDNTENDADDKQDGYTPEFRKEMNELFQQNKTEGDQQ